MVYAIIAKNFVILAKFYNEIVTDLYYPPPLSPSLHTCREGDERGRVSNSSLIAALLRYELIRLIILIDIHHFLDYLLWFGSISMDALSTDKGKSLKITDK